MGWGKKWKKLVKKVYKPIFQGAGNLFDSDGLLGGVKGLLSPEYPALELPPLPSALTTVPGPGQDAPSQSYPDTGLQERPVGLSLAGVAVILGLTLAVVLLAGKRKR